MSSRLEKLSKLEALLERTDGDAQRIDVVRRAQTFKRTWLQLAEGLVKLRRDHAYARWGFDDFYDYCHKELGIQRATVDKLTRSFGTVVTHAPAVLERDGVAELVPSVDAVDYFTRSIGGGDVPARPRDPDLTREFKAAVFDEGKPVAELRRTFDPYLNPRPQAAARLEVLMKASACARKLAELVTEIPDLPERRMRRLEEELGALRENLEGLAEPLREAVARSAKWSKSKEAKAQEAA